MANNINFGKIYDSTWWGVGVTSNSINWGKSYLDLAGGGGAPLLLDTYTGASVAYSLRKLTTAYAGSAIRVRRSSDNFESDIGFANNQLDTVSLLSFVGTGGTDNGFVTTWYDQSGNANNAVQPFATFQPKIVNAGTLILQNGSPTIDFDGVDDGLSFTSNGYNIDSLSSYVLGKYDDLGPVIMFAFSGFTGSARWYVTFGSNFGYAAATTAIPFTNDTNRNLFTMISGANLGNTSAWFNGSLQGTATRVSAVTSNENGIGGFLNTNNANCNIQEIICYSRDTSTDRVEIENNINSFY